MRGGGGRSLRRRRRRCRSDRGLTRRGRSRLRCAGTGRKQEGDHGTCRANQDGVFHNVNDVFTQQFVTRRAARRIKARNFYIVILARCFLTSARLRFDSRTLRLSAAGRGDRLRRSLSRPAISAARFCIRSC